MGGWEAVCVKRHERGMRSPGQMRARAPGSLLSVLAWCSAGVYLALIPLNEADLGKLEARGQEAAGLPWVGSH